MVEFGSDGRPPETGTPSQLSGINMLEPDDRATRIAARLPQVAGVVLLIIAAVTLVGWLAGVRGLVALSSGTAALKANTALCFVAIALVFITTRRVFAIVVAAIATLTLIEHGAGVDLGIDQLLCVDVFDTQNLPGRMALSSSLIMLDLCVALCAPRAWRGLGVGAGVVALSAGMIATLGYLFGAPPLYELGGTIMSPQAAALIVVASVGTLARWTDDGFLRVLVSNTTAGAAARLLLPLLLVGMMLTATICLVLEDAGSIVPRFSIVLLTAGNLLIAGAGVVWTTRSAVVVEGQKLAAELALERARQLSTFEARFHAVLEAAPFAVLAHREGKIVLANRRLSELFGYSDEQLIGMPAIELVHPDDRPRASVQLAASTTALTSATTLHALRPDGATLYIDSASATMLLDGLPTVVGSAIDVSDRVASAARLAVALAEKELLLTEVHHRVKNNLQIVVSLINLARDQVDDATAARLFDETGNRVRAMALLHERLYRSQDFANVNMDAYLTSVIEELVRSDPRADGIDVNLTVDVVLNLDQALPVGLVVNELVTNAFKYGFANGCGALRVGLIATGVGAALSVENDGPGLPEGFALEGGGGLGLPLVNGLARQLGGEVHFDRLAHGTRFTVTFPDNRSAP